MFLINAEHQSKWRVKKTKEVGHNEMRKKDHERRLWHQENRKKEHKHTMIRKKDTEKSRARPRSNLTL